MSETTTQPSPRAPAGGPAARLRSAAAWRDPAMAAIVAATALGLGLRLYQLARPGYLLGLIEYDDGSYFGSAVRLVHGSVPYRDFVFVQPPGITLLMTPAALIAKVTGTAWGMGIGRVLTTLASTAGVTLTGLLARHRGTAATVIACGLVAVYPDGVAAARTVLVEPWLVLFCLIGALMVFRGDGITGGRRLLLGGAAFGLAGAVEAWAIVPVLVVAALCLPHLRRAARFIAGVAAGFAVPVLPFAALAPVRFYQGLIVAQVGPRAAVTRVGVWYRLKEMTGLSGAHLPATLTIASRHIHLPYHQVIEATAAIVALLILGGLAFAWLATFRPPPALDWFAAATTAAIVGMFLWPSQFHYHFPAFLAPFLGLAIALPPSRLLRAGRPDRAAAAAVAVVIAVFAVFQARTEATARPLLPPATLAGAQHHIPAGACVVTDEVSLLIMTNRFVSGVPGCSPVIDGLGTDLALSGGLKPSTGAGRDPAVAAVWRQAFTHAGFVWLSRFHGRRIAWSPALRAYFTSHFGQIWADGRGDALYRRKASTEQDVAGMSAR